MITLEVKGLDVLQELAEKYPAVAESSVNSAINLALLRVLREEKQEAPFGVSGQLRDNWKIDMQRFEGRLYSLMKYAMDVEKGTPPHVVPVAEIAPWAAKKGIPAWVVVRAIAKKGTKANPFFARAVSDAEDGVNTEMQKAITNIIAKLGSGGGTL